MIFKMLFIMLVICDQWQPRPHLAPLSHHTSVTNDRQTTDDTLCDILSTG